ncbi:ABC transporter ATP-binding protein [Microbacterium aoyamense]|nr:ABC transporter ATP-binding protein [Microbacterium aoyamense]
MASSEVRPETGEAPIEASVEDLSKSFISKRRDVHAVRSIDLSIRKGEYVVVLGPSGCGKSTLMRCVAGLERPTGGRVRLHGRTVFDQSAGVDVKPEARNVGMVFQNYALWPHMSVEANVAYPLKRRGVRGQERTQRVAEVLETVECSPLAKRLPAELSGGQQQRVALARALASRPSLMLLDEPLSNLDALLRVSLRSELLRLHRELGFTALHITHDQAEALEMGDRVVLMREGEIEQSGTPDEVYTRPASPYAATFLGVRNKLTATLKNGQITHDGGWVGGVDDVVGAADGSSVRVFARPRDVRVVPATPIAERASHGDVEIEGRVAQIVLSEGGTHQFIVEVGETQWFAEQGDVSDVRLGDEVILSVPRASVLFYDTEGSLLSTAGVGAR